MFFPAAHLFAARKSAPWAATFSDPLRAVSSMSVFQLISAEDSENVAN
jgi:hypothetical protein